MLYSLWLSILQKELFELAQFVGNFLALLDFALLISKS